MTNVIENAYVLAQRRDQMMRALLKEWVRLNKPRMSGGEPLIPLPREVAMWLWQELLARLAYPDTEEEG